MKKLKKICLMVICATVLLILILPAVSIGGAFLVGWLFDPYGEGSAYINASNWQCESEKFYDTYIPHYQEKINELKVRYDLEFETKTKDVESESDDIIIFYLYNDEYTISLLFANRGVFGDFEVNLYYYGNEAGDLDNYELQRNLVCFINDITAYAAFDTRIEENSNHFDKLYQECIDTNTTFAEYNYEFNHFTGDIGYSVALKSSNHGEFYKMCMDYDLEKYANAYSFEGILKGIEE